MVGAGEPEAVAPGGEERVEVLADATGGAVGERDDGSGAVGHDVDTVEEVTCTVECDHGTSVDVDVDVKASAGPGPATSIRRGTGC